MLALVQLVYYHVSTGIDISPVTINFVLMTMFTVTDACSSSPCKNGAACKWAGGADYTCTCADGFSGSNCQTGI